MKLISTILISSLAFSCFGSTTSYDSVDVIDDSFYLSNFYAFSKNCNIDVIKWRDLQGEKSDDSLIFVGNVEFIVDDQSYKTERLKITNLKQKSNCSLNSKLVITVK